MTTEEIKIISDILKDFEEKFCAKIDAFTSQQITLMEQLKAEHKIKINHE
jgi:hypothetical protein